MKKQTRLDREKLIREIAYEIQNIIGKSKATFFVKNFKEEIPTDECLYELKAEISNNVGMYFVNKLKKLARPPKKKLLSTLKKKLKLQDCPKGTACFDKNGLPVPMKKKRGLNKKK